ncbi:hypothetical protein LSH36_3064g00000 [Paralvinella palmiformis]|uniref:Uncharacterized protein n=1 Tax=Paralvinella palmiformis TaxID=53620 RepID=A0AAD9MKY9_9ANNE|nr:hypothetical protein LSH36_3064g00000 [Paralvinella palmiformis]
MRSQISPAKTEKIYISRDYGIRFTWDQVSELLGRGETEGRERREKRERERRGKRKEREKRKREREKKV